MELILTLNGFIAFYVSGVIMSFWKLLYPSIKLLEVIDEESVILRYKWVVVIVWTIMATLTLPFILPAILFESIGEKFIISYVKQLDGTRK